MPARDPDRTARSAAESGHEASAHADAPPLLSESRFRADAARLAEGWERRFVIEGARAADFARLYESLGYEVIAEPVSPEEAMDDCTGCRIVALLAFRVIYTRVRPTNAAGSQSTEPPPNDGRR